MAVFTGPGQIDSGGTATPIASPAGLTWQAITGPDSFTATPILPMPLGVKGPNQGILYQQSGSVYTAGTGQIFPTGRS